MKSIANGIFIAVGTVSLVLGVLGVFLPLLPATPFFLLTSFCYLKGSERLHRKLLSNRIVGDYIKNFEQGRGIPKRAKIMAISMLWISLLYTLIMVETIFLKILIAVFALFWTVIILRMKTLENETKDV